MHFQEEQNSCRQTTLQKIAKLERAIRDCIQVTDILARLAICEKASIDECYLDITAEARRRLDASEQMQLPINPSQVHVCGEASHY